MLVGIRLMCSMTEPTDCTAAMYPTFFEDKKTCHLVADDFARELMQTMFGYGPVEFQCLEFSYSFPNA